MPFDDLKKEHLEPVLVRFVSKVLERSNKSALAEKDKQNRQNELDKIKRGTLKIVTAGKKLTAGKKPELQHILFEAEFKAKP